MYNQEEAERWCREHDFHFHYFKYPDKGPPGQEVSEGRSGWDVSGWAYPKDSHKDKVRIHKVGNTLAEAVEKAENTYEEVVR